MSPDKDERVEGSEPISATVDAVETVEKVDTGVTRRDFLAGGARMAALAFLIKIGISPKSALAEEMANSSTPTDAEHNQDPGINSELAEAKEAHTAHNLELWNSYLAIGAFMRAIQRYLSHGHFDENDWAAGLGHLAVHVAVSPHSALDSMKHIGFDLGMLLPVLIGTSWGDALPRIQQKVDESGLDEDNGKFEITDEMNVTQAALLLIDEALKSTKIAALSSGAASIHLDKCHAQFAYKKFFESSLNDFKRALDNFSSNLDADNPNLAVFNRTIFKTFEDLEDLCKVSLKPNEVNKLLMKLSTDIGNMDMIVQQNGSKAAFDKLREQFLALAKELSYDKNATPGTDAHGVKMKWDSMQKMMQALRSYVNNAGKLAVGDPPNYVLLVMQVLKGELSLEEASRIQVESFEAVLPNLLMDFDEAAASVSGAFSEEYPFDHFSSKAGSLLKSFGQANLAAIKTAIPAVKALSANLSALLDKGMSLTSNADHSNGDMQLDDRIVLDKASATGQVTLGNLLATVQLIFTELVPNMQEKSDFGKLMQFVEEYGRTVDGDFDIISMNNSRDIALCGANEKWRRGEKPDDRHAKRSFIKAFNVASERDIKCLLNTVKADRASLEILKDAIMSTKDVDGNIDASKLKESGIGKKLVNVFGDLNAAREHLMRSILIGDLAARAKSNGDVFDHDFTLAYARETARKCVTNDHLDSNSPWAYLDYAESISTEILPLVKEKVGAGTEEVVGLVMLQLIYLQSLMPSVNHAIGSIIEDYANRDEHGILVKNLDKLEEDEYLPVDVSNKIVTSLIGLCSVSAIADNMAMYMACAKVLSELKGAGLISHETFLLHTKAVFKAAIEFGALTAAGGPASAPYGDEKTNAIVNGWETVIANACSNIPYWDVSYVGDFMNRLGKSVVLRSVFKAASSGAKALLQKRKNEGGESEESFMAKVRALKKIESHVDQVDGDEQSGADMSVKEVVVDKIFNGGAVGIGHITDTVVGAWKKKGRKKRADRDTAFVQKLDRALAA